MGKVKNTMPACLGSYENQPGKCSGCLLARLCIDATIAADAYWDSVADRIREIEEMEADVGWSAEHVGSYPVYS